MIPLFIYHGDNVRLFPLEGASPLPQGSPFHLVLTQEFGLIPSF